MVKMRDEGPRGWVRRNHLVLDMLGIEMPNRGIRKADGYESGAQKEGWKETCMRMQIERRGEMKRSFGMGLWGLQNGAGLTGQPSSKEGPEH